MLRVENIIKSYGTIKAVQGLSFDVENGRIFGLLGPNGAGKTTTVSAICGLVKPDSGSVTLDGASDYRAKIGVAPQSLSLYDELTALENLLFFADLYGGAPRLRANELLERVGLSDRAKSKVKTYSGGMKRRLNLACALIHEPQVLLLDEPTVGVDPQSRAHIFDVILALKKAGRSIVYTTHYMEEAQKLCDTIAIVDHGKLLTMGTPAELVAKHGGSVVITGTRAGEPFRTETRDPMPELQKLFASGEIKQLKIDEPDLESVFLAMTGRSLRD